MKKILLTLLASAGLACAELSPEDFNQLRSAVINYNGAHFVGVSRIGNSWLYRFNNAQNNPIAFIPMEVGDYMQAHAAFVASMGTMILCRQQWGRRLDMYINREIPLPPPPPPGFTEPVWTE
jgi:hypothetical protein